MIGWVSLLALVLFAALVEATGSGWYLVPFLAAVVGVGYELSRRPE